MFYRNDSRLSPYALSLPGCSQRCPLQDFVNITREVITLDWNKECQLSKESTDSGKRMYINKSFFGFFFYCFQLETVILDLLY